MINKLDNIERMAKEQRLQIKDFKGGLRNGYEVVLEGENYTLGKSIEYAIYNMFYQGSVQQIVSYVGFYKQHPHDEDSILRIGFKNETTSQQVSQYILNVVDELKKLYVVINGLV